MESPQPGQIRRLYAISRLQRGLDDLEVAQCLFAGEEVTNPNHVGVIAHGTGVHGHHCIFRGLKIGVVYWTPGSVRHATTHCVHDLYVSAVWTAGIASDLEYRNNVVTGCHYVWTAQGGATARADAGGPAAGETAARRAPDPPPAYQVVGSHFANNRRPRAHGPRRLLHAYAACQRLTAAEK